MAGLSDSVLLDHVCVSQLRLRILSRRLSRRTLLLGNDAVAPFLASCARRPLHCAIPHTKPGLTAGRRSGALAWLWCRARPALQDSFPAADNRAAQALIGTLAYVPRYPGVQVGTYHILVLRVVPLKFQCSIHLNPVHLIVSGVPTGLWLLPTRNASHKIRTFAVLMSLGTTSYQLGTRYAPMKLHVHVLQVCIYIH